MALIWMRGFGPFRPSHEFVALGVASGILTSAELQQPRGSSQEHYYLTGCTFSRHVFG